MTHPPNPVLLAVSPLPPWPVGNGYALRVFGLLEALAPRWSILLVAPAAPDGSLVPAGIATHLPDGLAGSGRAYPWRFDNSILRAAALNAARQYQPSRALVWPGAEALWFDADPGLPPAVMDMIDANPLEFWNALQAGPGLRDRVRAAHELLVATRFARRTVRSFTATACVGERDAAWLMRIGGRGRVHVVPNGVALPPESTLAPEAPLPTLAFTGTLDFPPNVAAVRHAVEHVWPHVRADFPQARFVIAGRRPLPDIAALHGRDGIEIAADVPDMTALLSNAWVAVAPMRTGAGIKNKVLEAWACARPVVLTRLATNGLVLPEGHDDLVHDRAEAMAQAVIALFQDAPRRHRLGQAARSLVAERFTWQAAGAQIDTLLRRPENP